MQSPFYSYQSIETSQLEEAGLFLAEEDPIRAATYRSPGSVIKRLAKHFANRV